MIVLMAVAANLYLGLFAAAVWASPAEILAPE